MAGQVIPGRRAASNTGYRPEGAAMAARSGRVRGSCTYWEGHP